MTVELYMYTFACVILFRGWIFETMHIAWSLTSGRVPGVGVYTRYILNAHSQTMTQHESVARPG